MLPRSIVCGVVTVLLAVALSGAAPAALLGQLQPLTPRGTTPGKPALTSLRDQFLISTQPGGEQKPYQLTAAIRCDQPGQQVFLIVTAQLAKGCHLYSLTQGDEVATKLEVAVNDAYRIVGPFRARQAPEVVGAGTSADPIQEKHYGTVEFELPIEISPTADWKQLSIDVRINGQVCQGEESCHLVRNAIVTAKFAGFDVDLKRQLADPGDKVRR